MNSNNGSQKTKSENFDGRTVSEIFGFVKSLVARKSFIFVSLVAIAVLLIFVAFLLYFLYRDGLVLRRYHERSAGNPEASENKLREDGLDGSPGEESTTDSVQQKQEKNRFTVTYNKDTMLSELRLGDELIMTYNTEGGFTKDAECNAVRLPASPVVNQDGSKVYFVDPKDGLPNQVKVMDIRKNISTVYTAPSDYPFIASIVLGAGEKLAYTLFDRVPRSYCSDGKAADVDVRVVFVIDGKRIPGPSRASSTPAEIVAFGKNYYVTRPNMMMVMTFCSGPEGVEIWRISDNSSAYAAFGPLVYYDFENNNVFVYGEGGGCQKLHNSLKRVNLDTGDIENIFGGPSFYIRVEQITQNSIVLRYLENYDKNQGDPPFDKGKTFEYKFKEN